MSRERNKLSKDELREDEFLEGVMSAVDYVRDHYQLFLAGLVVLIVGIAGAEYVVRSQQQTRAEAVARLGDALMLQEQGQEDEAVQTLQRVSEDKAGTPAAAQAVIMLANHYFDQGDYDRARVLYQRYLDDYGDNPVLSYAAGSGLAAILKAQGKTAAAAAAYRKLAQEHAGQMEEALALWEAAACYQKLGDEQQRREVLEKIVEKHDKLPLAAKARDALAAAG